MTDLDKLEAPRSAFYNEMRRQGYKTMDIAEIDDRALCDAIINAHLAAQRQGGDADGMPDELWIGVGADDPSLEFTAIRENEYGVYTKYIRADLAHPPAVTGDRGAALQFFEDVMQTNPCVSGKEPEAETIRAALSAQGGVPGEVLEKVAVALEFYGSGGNFHGHGPDGRLLPNFSFEFDNYGHGGAYVEDGTKAKEALTLLQPYINNGRGGR